MKMYHIPTKISHIPTEARYWLYHRPVFEISLAYRLIRNRLGKGKK